MKGRFFILLLGLFTAAAIKAAVPDFAYPQTVSRQAEESLDKALTSGDGIAVVRSLANLGLAQSAIGNEKLPDVVKRIENIEQNEKNPITHSLLCMLLADIYSDVYNVNRYTYDRREQPVEPLPESYNQWSGKQFRNRISELCSKAMVASAELQGKKLSDFASIINADSETLIYYPTLYDFAASFTIAKRRMLGDFYNVFSRLYLGEWSEFVVMPKFVPGSPEAVLIMQTYSDWLRFHENDIAPLVNVDLQRINFVSAGLYYSSRDEAIKQVSGLYTGLYDKYKNHECSADILLAIYNHLADFDKKLLFNDMRKAIEAFPAYHRRGCLQNAVAQMQRESLSVQAPTCVAPGHEFELTVNTNNVLSANIDIYSVTLANPAGDSYRSDSGVEKLVKSVHVDFQGDIPFSQSRTVKITIDAPGCYIARVRGVQGDRYYPVIRCSLLSIGIQGVDLKKFMIVNPLSGSPVENAVVNRLADRNISAARIGVTDRDGFVAPASTNDKYCYYSVSKGNDSFASPLGTVLSSVKESKSVNIISGFTNLTIYHPGDSVKFVGIAYTASRDTHAPLADSRIESVLFNANGQPVDTIIGVSDEFGRVSGAFKLATEGLTGQAHIMLKCEGAVKNVWFTVSDYKVPTFHAEIVGVLHETPHSGMVTLKGFAKTYTGVPVDNAQVKMNLASSGISFWDRSNLTDFYSSETHTDKDGNFSIEIPAEAFKFAPNPDGLFTARISVTSLAGESRECKSSFTLGKKFTITAVVPQAYEVKKNSAMALSVKIEDGEQKPIVQKVEYEIVNLKDSVVGNGSFMLADAMIDFNKIASGEYYLRLMSDNCEPLKTNTIVVYRLGDKSSPASAVLWSAVSNKTVCVDNTGKYNIVLAASSQPTFALYTLVNERDGKLLEQRWVKLPIGVQEFQIQLPADVACAKANFFAVKDFNQSVISIDVKNKRFEKKYLLNIDNLRDKISPGAKETLSISTAEVGFDSAGVKSAVVLNMWNAALQGVGAISMPNLSLGVYKGDRLYYRLISPNLGYKGQLCFYDSAVKSVDCNEIVSPAWEFYGRSFNSIVHIRGRNKMLTTSAGGIMVEESKMMIAAAPADFAMAKSEIADNAVEEAADDSADNGAEANTSSLQTEDFEYRDVATPSAFFYPMLGTGSDGKHEFVFTMPNANAQWQFQALAYDKSMRTATFEKVIFATRPIMVQSNLPRFMRYGDSSVVKASVTNNSDEEQTVNVITEFFNIANGMIKQRDDTTVSILPGESAIVGSCFIAPNDTPFIGYRIKAVANGYADGEQQILPLLPFTTPVFETTPFYMAPDSSEINVKLPLMEKDARVTLQFCDNPSWYVVTALPGLQKDEPVTALQAADALFSAAVAKGMLRKYPEIRDVLKKWSSNVGDSALVSMLEKNNDLKIMLLSSTPWVADAENDSERMQRLALLFNETEIDSTIDKAIAVLEKLQSSTGGFSWHPSWNEPSQWVTLQVAAVIGRLNKLGFMPENKRIKSMMPKALNWLEKEMVKQWQKNRNSTFADYVAMRDLWSDVTQSALGKQLIASTIQKMVSGWKGFDINGKAVAASLLSAHGYKAVAKLALASISEYAVVSAESGMHWPSVADAASGSVAELEVAVNALDAYVAIDPECREIDLIRQWLVVEKETRNWGTGASVSNVIASFLACGDNWIIPAGGINVILAGKEVEVGYDDMQLGNGSVELNPADASNARLNIVRSGHTPTWGAVYCRYMASPDHVVANGCDALTIEKRMFRQNGDVWEEADTYKVGDRVRIQLVITANRALDYVTVVDDRAACFEPVNQLPGWIFAEGIGFYRENRDSSTNIFVSRMPKGTYLLSYDFYVNNSGNFASGLATAQSQYAPQISAHSAGFIVVVEP